MKQLLWLRQGEIRTSLTSGLWLLFELHRNRKNSTQRWNLFANVSELASSSSTDVKCFFFLQRAWIAKVTVIAKSFPVIVR